MCMLLSHLAKMGLCIHMLDYWKESYAETKMLNNLGECFDIIQKSQVRIVLIYGVLRSFFLFMRILKFWVVWFSWVRSMMKWKQFVFVFYRINKHFLGIFQVLLHWNWFMIIHVYGLLLLLHTQWASRHWVCIFSWYFALSG